MKELKDKIKAYFESNTGFSLLAIGWILFTLIIPILVINNNYHLWVKDDSGLRFTGWALVCILIAFVVIYAFISYIISAFSVKYRTWVKLLKGFKNIILPLILLYILSDIASENIITIKSCLWWIMISEAIGVIINPFPYWVYKHKVKDTKEMYFK